MKINKQNLFRCALVAAVSYILYVVPEVISLKKESQRLKRGLSGLQQMFVQFARMSYPYMWPNNPHLVIDDRRLWASSTYQAKMDFGFEGGHMLPEQFSNDGGHCQAMICAFEDSPGENYEVVVGVRRVYLGSKQTNSEPCFVVYHRSDGDYLQRALPRGGMVRRLDFLNGDHEIFDRGEWRRDIPLEWNYEKETMRKALNRQSDKTNTVSNAWKPPDSKANTKIKDK